MRKLASIQMIAEIQPIAGADAIEKVRVNDWWCVAKVREFQVGDLCVYFEIDSLLPMTPTFEFLANRGTSKSELEDGTIVEGYRLKTIRLRKQLSQGLALPVSILNSTGGFDVGDDLTSVLGVHKYEKPMNAQLRGQARGNFPSFLRKSDQERCQNLRTEIWDAYEAGDEFEVSVKLDGSSMTAFYITEHGAEHHQTESRFGVCSRNLELKETEDNAFWKIARLDDIEAKLTNLVNFIRGQGANEYPDAKHHGLMIQGELVAPNIQGNFEGVDKPEFYVYNIFNIDTQQFTQPVGTRLKCESMNLKHVPVLHKRISLKTLFPDATQDTIIPLLLEYADGESGLNGKYREGLVFKRADGQFSFKAISNRYLEKENE